MHTATKKKPVAQALLFILISTAGLVALSVYSAACSPAANRRAANTALDAANVICIIANAESDDATIARVCNITDALLPDLREIVNTSRAASRKYALEHATPKDAGADR
jgi:hypothetical protein